MPYKDIASLPIRVLSLPNLGQQMWMRAFNRAVRTNTQSHAAQIAWDVLTVFYVRKNNKWKKRK